MYRINVGCGTTPTVGWLNFDNSFSLKLSKFSKLSTILYNANLINRPQLEYIQFCQQTNVEWANVTRKIPIPNNSSEVVYSSHMLEHLDRDDAMVFLQEAKRVLATGGIIRLALPDIEKKVRSYVDDADADLFVASTNMCVPRPRSFSQRLRIVVVGTRHHQWMYDGKSLCKLLTGAGFTDAKIFAAGGTRISNPAPLDLFERADESVYVEAVKA